MAGLLMSAIVDEEDAGTENDPLEMGADQRRTFLAERFGVPFDYPRSELPEGVVPEEAQVLAVFEHPEREGTRMVLARFREPLGEALGRLSRFYEAEGWEGGEPQESRRARDPEATLDRGWLVVFERGARRRFVYVREREGPKETLAAICDMGY
jgi:hypothetical protein